ncbi:MAG TPA: PatB family C-S lyase [Bacteroidales bacterium]|nr:PatB family C-S lyase [Bacteroidales bacterium]
MFDFDKPINRENTFSVKWDNRTEVFGTNDVYPLWVADMDFEAPKEVTDAILKRAEHRVYGYSLHADAYFNAFISWSQRKHNWEVQREWCFFSPGIVPALAVAVQTFTGEWDKVLVQSPVYNPFFDVVEGNKRELVHSPLILKNGRYHMDYESLEKEFAGGVKLMLLCNPHNPGGRVWSKEELTRLAELSLKYEVVVFSDEIHCDLVYPNQKHTPYLSLGEKYLPFSAVSQSPSKTFNIAGLSSSVVVIADKEMRDRMKNLMETIHLCMGNIFGTEAFKTAYTLCDSWHSELISYLEMNLKLATSFIQNQLPVIKVMQPDAGFLLWLDFSDLGLSDKMLNEFLVTKAGLGLSAGVMYGHEGSGFMRLNFGLNRAQLEKCLIRLQQAVNSLPVR